MSDIVKKYQHYFNESVKLQEMVNEQAAYIAELEEALEELMEVYRMTPGRKKILKKENDKAWRTRLSTIPPDRNGVAVAMSADQERTHDRAAARNDRIALIKLKTKPLEKREFGDHPTLSIFPDEQENHDKQLSDKALNRDLKAQRKKEKKK